MGGCVCLPQSFGFEEHQGKCWCLLCFCLINLWIVYMFLLGSHSPITSRPGTVNRINKESEVFYMSGRLGIFTCWQVELLDWILGSFSAKVQMLQIFLTWSGLNFSTVRGKLTQLGSPFLQCIFPGLCWDNDLPWCLRTQTDGHVDCPTDRTLGLKRLASLFKCWGQGSCNANIHVKSQRDVKTAINGSHAFPAKVCEPCTANLSCHETPTPALFSLHHRCLALTQPAVSSIINSHYRLDFPPLDGQAACSFEAGC